MNEWHTTYQVTGAGFGLVLTALLYTLGGRNGKWNRRFIASLILSSTVITLCVLRQSFSWWLLLIYPLLVVGYSLGYGADALGAKIIRRLVYALGVLMSGVLCAWVLGGWWVLIPHAGVGLWSIYMGVKNPIDSPAEEFVICMLLGLGLIMYPFV